MLILSCTNRKASLTGVVADYYQELLSQKGKKSTILSLTRLPADFTSSALYTNRDKHPIINEMVAEIADAKKIVFVVPEYHSSFPGVLKAFIDAMPDKPSPFRDKKGALIGVSAGHQGNSLGLSHLTDIVQYLGMQLMGSNLKLSRLFPATRERLMQQTNYLPLLGKHVAQFIGF